MFQRLAKLIRPASIASAGTPVELPVTDTGDAAVCQTPGESTALKTSMKRSIDVIPLQKNDLTISEVSNSSRPEAKTVCSSSDVVIGRIFDNLSEAPSDLPEFC